MTVKKNHFHLASCSKKIPLCRQVLCKERHIPIRIDRMPVPERGMYFYEEVQFLLISIMVIISIIYLFINDY